MIDMKVRPEFKSDVVLRDEKDVVRIGTVCVFLFLGCFALPYIQGFLKGTLGFATTTNGRKRFTISQMIESSNTVLQVGFVFSFICFGNIYLAWQNFFDERDYRIIVPLCSYVFGFCMIMLLWVPSNKYKVQHIVLAIMVFVSGTIFNLAIFLLYRDYYEMDQNLEIMKFCAIAATTIFGMVVLLAIAHAVRPFERIGKVHYLDVYAGLELVHVMFLTVTIYTVSNLPPLPSRCVTTGDLSQMS